MDDFFNKIKKKLSVDNIVDLMKDGKLKEEIKQTLTAGVNLNEKPKPDDFKPCLDVSSIEHCIEEGKSNVQSNEYCDKQDTRPITIATIIEPEVHVTMKNSYPKIAEGQIELTEKRSQEQLNVEVNNRNEEVPISSGQKMSITDEKKCLINENTKIQTGSMKSDEIETIKDNTIVLQKPVISQHEQEHADDISYEMFLG